MDDDEKEEKEREREERHELYIPVKEDNRRKTRGESVTCAPFGLKRSTGKFENQSFALVIASMRPFPYILRR